MKPLLDRGPLGKTAGCLVMLVFLALELAVLIGIAAIVGGLVGPLVGSPRFDSDEGAGFWIALAIGLAAAAYPVILIDRLAKRIAGYSPFTAAGEINLP